MSEMADHQTSMLAPTWDCKIPLNVNDSDLSPEMKEPPVVQGSSTDAMFAVVRSELGDFVRYTMFYLDFTNPALKPIFKPIRNDVLTPEAAEIDNLEKMIEDKYLRLCDLENPLHFMTTWWTRSHLAKCRFLEHHSRHSTSSVTLTDEQRDTAIALACRMLECDTQHRGSPLAKRFLWLTHMYFPFPAYIQILQDLRRRPGSELARKAWEVMSDNYDTCSVFINEDSDSPFFRVFAKMLLDAWETCEGAFSQGGDLKMLVTPRIVSSMRHRVTQVDKMAQIADIQRPDGVNSVGIDDISMSMPLPMGSLYNMGGHSGYGLGVYSNVPGLLDVNQLDWSTMDWGFGGAYSGAWNAGL
jgi:hypothetical protein